MAERILVIDDDENLLKSIKKILKLENYAVDTLVNALQADQQLEIQEYHCLILDVKMPAINGMEVLKKVLQKYPHLPVIMISGQSDIETAVQAIKDGAYDFIEKPINPERLFITVKNAIQKFNLQEMSDSIFNELQDQFRMISQSPAMKKVCQQIAEVAGTPAKVLILGESGTGKELAAWAIHYNSLRKGKPYIKVNCAAIPAELLESELFGHRKGSFTGAISDRKGKFLEADGGTLFLDEIGDMSIPLQAKVLRAFEEDEVEVIGENIPRKVDVRIVAATNQNLQQLIAEGKFREDLYYRLNVIKIIIPPLRERREDILPLTYHFLREFRNSYNKKTLCLKSAAESLLVNFDWPGNVRQLRNVIEKMVIFSHDKEISYKAALDALEVGQSWDRAGNGEKDSCPQTLKDALQHFERNYILTVLQKHQGKLTDTARSLGIDRSNLFKKMRTHGLKT
ncbi:MAG: sigma-54-dependent Fis family transcriptional regulator [Calditrichaceae bacterium]|nr:sigma-54 dependent transcriptional regulator [Calditrichia bacterium]NUQ40218.1 sigma-54-dependent Fis family transcriptional regulator [Calditrichaceae bacterium]